MGDSIASPMVWVVFTIAVFIILVADMLIFHRKPHVIHVKEAGMWVIGWVSLALLFNAGVYYYSGSERGLEFTTGYLVEFALSVDNMFVFALIFTYFAVPKEYQHRALFWGIFGALLMRLVFILIGAALLDRFHWIIYVFGAFLVYTGIKILKESDVHVDPETNIAFRLFRRFIPMTDTYRAEHFTVVEAGKRYATPLLAVLVLINVVDLVFAMDSVPAIFAVTDDAFIVYSSNVFAILGLRSLYFLLAGIMDMFRYLKVGLGAVLAFVGIKMLLSEVYHIPIGLSLGIIIFLIGTSVVASLVIKEKEDDGAELDGDEAELVHSASQPHAPQSDPED